MADFYDAQDAADPVRDTHAAGGLSFANLIGATISLALVVGIAVWGYKLLVRDVTGIPVVRAVEGPMRVQPDNPGGEPAEHQGLAVNAVAALGTAEPPADKLMLAPKPIELQDEDAAPVAVQAAAETKDPSPEDDRLAEAVRAGSVEALVAQLALGVRPISQVDEAPGPKRVAAPIVAPEPLSPGAIAPVNVSEADEAPVEEAAPERRVQTIDAPGVALSPRPRIRPAVQRAVMTEDSQAQVIQAAVSAAMPRDVAPDTIPVGTRLVQLGAFDTPEIARSEWDRLASRFGDYMGGKARVVQQAASGGRTFYRLRAMGFDDLNDARRFCSALVAEGADCIPVVTR
jgi:hypothetical protein